MNQREKSSEDIKNMYYLTPENLGLYEKGEVKYGSVKPISRSTVKVYLHLLRLNKAISRV